MDNLYQELTGDDLIRAIAVEIRRTLNNLERNIMADFDQLLTEVEAQRSMLTELTKVVSDVHGHMTAASSGAVIAASTQTHINTVMNAIMANRGLLVTALEKMHIAAAMAEAQKENPIQPPATPPVG